ncbi:fumarylacetoacetase [Rhizomonospora bruguierae]|uniref:fumarylacetoacetase n=1 Tax=Rhizomonospora bruguierae TaxID=1581705 RepID=UPI001BCE81D4|nr:fumarylacetoacetase [Micromonospora sp. NBRC 107566]
MTWVPGAAGGGFGARHLPYGAFTRGDAAPRLGARIGDFVLDLAAAERAELVLAGGSLCAPTLNAFLALGRPQWTAVRARLVDLLTDERHRPAVEPLLSPVSDVEPVLAWSPGDYVDFYSSEYHATNVGRILRPGQEPLLPNWKHLPIGYHGRAGTLIVSGTPVVRPCGQRRSTGAGEPVFGPSARLDIEAEVGFVVGVPSALGERVPTGAFANHVFGVVLVNDWSARDIQAWEYQPLGPFLAKSFATSVAAWITPLEALGAAWVPAPRQEPPVQEYLREEDRRGLDLALTVEWNGTLVSRPPFAGMYWTPAQQLAHLTVNGAALRTGDLYASGTVSGPERAQTGSFLELTRSGAEPVTLAGGESRMFLADGDTVTIGATAPGPDGTRITLAPVTGSILAPR